MTTYNGSVFILPQLQSLSEQTRLPDEVIICDDNSADDTVRIVREFIEENALDSWIVCQNEKNLGYIENFRKAMSLTTGDIVFLCDQDDVWQSEKIATMEAIMEANLDVTALASGYSHIDRFGNLITEKIRKFYNPPIFCRYLPTVSRVRHGRILYANVAQGCTMAYRRSLVDTYCVAKNCTRMPHDWALNMMAYETRGLFFLNRELLLYRLHGNNTIGVGNKNDAIICRIPRLNDYVDEINDAQQLPLLDRTKREIRDIVKLTHARIHFLKKKQITVWLAGLMNNFLPFMRFYILQYIKDLLLVLLGKIPQ